MAGRPYRRTRDLPARHANRAHFWREQIDRAETPGDQLWQCYRWLLSLAAKARKGGHTADADHALAQAAQAIADVAAGFEGRMHRD
jgi:hypothetical protein